MELDQTDLGFFHPCWASCCFGCLQEETGRAGTDMSDHTSPCSTWSTSLPHQCVLTRDMSGKSLVSKRASSCSETPCRSRAWTYLLIKYTTCDKLTVIDGAANLADDANVAQVQPVQQQKTEFDASKTASKLHAALLLATLALTIDDQACAIPSQTAHRTN